MRVIPIQTSNQRPQIKPISFKSTSSSEASLSLQNSDNTQFKKNLKDAAALDAVQSNMVTALFSKIGKALNPAWNAFKKYTKDFLIPRPFIADYNNNGDIADELVAVAPYMM